MGISGCAIHLIAHPFKPFAPITTVKNLCPSGGNHGGDDMPQFPFTQALTANQLGFNPLSGWQYEWTPYPCSVLLLIRSTTLGTKITIFSASETIQERTPIQGGGTAGVTPSELNTPAVSFLAPGGDRLKLVIDETSGLTPTVDGVVILNPL
jgi:hypothetical protein